MTPQRTPQRTRERDVAVEANGLVKNFGTKRALDGVDVVAATGSVLAVLGLNGAGKTTLARTLSTLLRPDGGSARVAGYDVVDQAHDVRARIALTGQFAAVDDDLTGRANLVLVARLLGMSRQAARVRADGLLDDFDLAEVGSKLVKTYSGGMRRRLDLAVSLVGRPEVLFLDEPTTGLDPRSRGDVWHAVRALVATGTTVFLTTQYLEEADRLSDDVVVVDHGRVVERGSPDELKARLGNQSLHVRPVDPAHLGEVATALAALSTAEPAPGPTVGSLAAPVVEADAVPELVRRLDAAGVRIAELALVRPTLDDVFLALTGGPAERGPAERGAAESNAAESNAAVGGTAERNVA